MISREAYFPAFPLLSFALNSPRKATAATYMPEAVPPKTVQATTRSKQYDAQRELVRNTIGSA